MSTLLSQEGNMAELIRYLVSSFGLGASFLMTSSLWCLGHMVPSGPNSQAYKQRDHLGAGSSLTLTIYT